MDGDHGGEAIPVLPVRSLELPEVGGLGHPIETCHLHQVLRAQAGGRVAGVGIPVRVDQDVHGVRATGGGVARQDGAPGLHVDGQETLAVQDAGALDVGGGRQVCVRGLGDYAAPVGEVAVDGDGPGEEGRGRPGGHEEGGQEEEHDEGDEEQLPAVAAALRVEPSAPEAVRDAPTVREAVDHPAPDALQAIDEAVDAPRHPVDAAVHAAVHAARERGGRAAAVH